MKSVLAQSDWFIYYGISCTTHLRAKQDSVPFRFSYGRRTFLINGAIAPNNTKKATKFGNKVLRDMHLPFLLLCSDKRTQDVFKMFCLQITTGWQAEVPQNCYKNFKIYPKTVMLGICWNSYSPQCRWIIVNYHSKRSVYWTNILHFHSRNFQSVRI